MSNSAQTSASNRINALLDENSFVEVGAYVTARSTDFNMTDRETPADGVVTGYYTICGSFPVSHVKVCASCCYISADFNKTVLIKQCINSVTC